MQPLDSVNFFDPPARVGALCIPTCKIVSESLWRNLGPLLRSQLNSIPALQSFLRSYRYQGIDGRVQTCLEQGEVHSSAGELYKTPAAMVSLPVKFWHEDPAAFVSLLQESAKELALLARERKWEEVWVANDFERLADGEALGVLSGVLDNRFLLVEV
jgi:hypothetical protein